MKRDKITLKTYFETGDYPTEAQFIDLIDSFLNIEEEDAVTGITDNGDGTYIFQLLSGGTVTLDIQGLPDEIPIANVVGLQAIIDGWTLLLGTVTLNPNDGSLEMTDGLTILGGQMKLNGNGTGGSNIVRFRLMESNGSTEQAKLAMEGSNNLFLQNTVTFQSLQLVGGGGVNGFRFYDGTTSQSVWHQGNDQNLFPISASELPGGQDLNTYQTAGFYYQSANADATSGSNYPPDLRAGSLIVQKSAGVTQQYYTYNDGSPEMWFRAFYSPNSPQWSNWLKVWHSGNDGSGSGLDADLLDGLSSGNYARAGLRTDSYIWARRSSGSGTATFYITQQGAGDIARFLQGAGDGSLVARITNNGELINRTGYAVENPNNSSASVRLNWNNNIARIRIGGSGSGTSGGFQIQDAGDDVIFRVDSVGNQYFDQGARIRRNSHVGGYLEGSYNTVGANANQSNPIYVIGSSYIPNDTSLGNMYGIGFSNGSASFLNSTDLGTNPSGWGLYVASDGNARIFLNGSNGHGYYGGNVYADNFILSSDERLKKNVVSIKKSFDFGFYEFEFKKREGDKRYGVIAQEVEKKNPELVYTDEEGMKQVKYIDLLIGKIAELEQRIKALEAN
ncbi:MAG: pyocin knob domain-containing S74 family peptidase [Saonia sp.]